MRDLVLLAIHFLGTLAKLSLRHIEEMMAGRGVFVDHATVHRLAIKMLPVLAAVLRKRSARPGSLTARGGVERFRAAAGAYRSGCSGRSAAFPVLSQ